MVGLAEGLLVGVAVVGVAVGSAEGLNVVGLAEGLLVGVAVVGPVVGLAEGPLVGVLECASVGKAEGAGQLVQINGGQSTELSSSRLSINVSRQSVSDRHELRKCH